MDGPLFDALLKNALEEALRQDAAEAPVAPKASRRHRKRMRRLFSGPRRMRPVRWAAAVALAALLTGTAAGYALGGGFLFQRMFEESPWAEVYGGAADTDQLLKMGGQLDTQVVESNGLRLEMMDAVSDGQMAMISVRLTVLEPDSLGWDGGGSFRETDVAGPDGAEIGMYSLATSTWRAEKPGDLEKGQYRLIFSINDTVLTEGGQYVIHLKDFCTGRELNEVLLPGEWTLAVTLPPAQVLDLTPEGSWDFGGGTWQMERLTLSPLALNMDFRLLEGVWDRQWDFLEEITVNLRDGRSLRDVTSGATGSDTQLSLTLEFQMPVDLSQIESVTVAGRVIPVF